MPTICLSVFEHFVGLAPKGLKSCLALITPSPTQITHLSGNKFPNKLAQNAFNSILRNPPFCCFIFNCNGEESSRRPSQIACTQTALHVNENSCMVLIVCKNNLNLSMCSSFFFRLCAWLPPLIDGVVILAPSLRCADFLFVLTLADFVVQP